MNTVRWTPRARRLADAARFVGGTGVLIACIVAIPVLAALLPGGTR